MGSAQIVVDYTVAKALLCEPKKIELVHQLVFSCERVESEDKTSYKKCYCKQIPADLTCYLVRK